MLASALLTTAPAAQAADAEIANRLLAGYPGILASVRANDVTFADGSILPLDDGAGPKPFEAWLDHPDIEDMFAQPYLKGAAPPPGAEYDPGRARNEPFFLKVYGDCRKGGVEPSLVTVVWLPSKSRQDLKVTARNGVAERLRAVSSELDRLPAEYDRYLVTPASTYNCRTIAGTKRRSAHAFGIAIDIAVQASSYWRWEKGRPAAAADHTQDLPPAIVDIFEKHGFIWGGKWSHFDSMHFEYRPELIPPETAR